jgi:hypothetical protein
VTASLRRIRPIIPEAAIERDDDPLALLDDLALGEVSR